MGGPLRVARLTAADRDEAKALFALMADVFHEACQQLSDEYVDSLLKRREFGAIAATVDREIVGGLTAHTLPLTRAASSDDVHALEFYRALGGTAAAVTLFTFTRAGV